MTLHAWLNGRLAETPPELSVAVRDLLTDAEEGMASPAAMARSALIAFERIADGPQTRECALDLLAADALLTYAFEAAGDPSVGGSAHATLELADAVGPAGALGRLAGGGA